MQVSRAGLRKRIQQYGFWGMSLVAMLTVIPIVMIVGYIYCRRDLSRDYRYVLADPRHGNCCRSPWCRRSDLPRRICTR
jgi:hypothetical protein